MIEQDVTLRYATKPKVLGVYLRLKSLSVWDIEDTVVRVDGRPEKAKEYTFFVAHSVRQLSALCGIKQTTLYECMTKFVRDGFMKYEVRTTLMRRKLPKKAAYFFRVMVYLETSQKWLTRTFPEQNPNENPNTLPGGTSLTLQQKKQTGQVFANETKNENPQIVVNSFLRMFGGTSHVGRRIDALRNANREHEARGVVMLLQNMVHGGLDLQLIDRAWAFVDLVLAERDATIGRDTLFYLREHWDDVLEQMRAELGGHGSGEKNRTASRGGGLRSMGDALARFQAPL